MGDIANNKLPLLVSLVTGSISPSDNELFAPSKCRGKSIISQNVVSLLKSKNNINSDCCMIFKNKYLRLTRVPNRWRGSTVRQDNDVANNQRQKSTKHQHSSLCDSKIGKKITQCHFLHCHAILQTSILGNMKEELEANCLK
jgi:hypothetical protein